MVCKEQREKTALERMIHGVLPAGCYFSLIHSAPAACPARWLGGKKTDVPCSCLT